MSVLIFVTIGMILGFMLFFPIVVAPTVFTILNEKQSSLFLRSFFPKYYLFGIILCMVAISFTFILEETLTLIFFLVMISGFIYSRQILTPAINKARDDEIKGNKKSKIKFEKLHRISVIINIIQILLCIFMLINFLHFNFKI